jgi:hypothetical protein
MSLPFAPSADVAAILNGLLDTLERRVERADGQARRAIRLPIDALNLPGYHSQADPAPRQVANEQLQRLERDGAVRLAWLPGETGHLLSAVTLNPDRAGDLFALLNRTPLAARRTRLADLLLGERFRFDDWRLRAIQHCLAQLKERKSPAPFSLVDEAFNRDLLAALAALDGVREETPYRVFSARVFNDSKRFEALMRALAILARRSQANWRALTNDETLRELNLVANPTHLYLHGAWRLVDDAGQVLSLDGFQPSAGVPTALAARLRQADPGAGSVVCVENQTTFYELIRHEPAVPAICLWGNPSPACRHLLRCLPEGVTLYAWADLDYGGLNIVAQLRQTVRAGMRTCRMDIETLEAHAAWARPLTPADARNLARLMRRPVLSDLHALIAHMLQRGLKLEQEAIRFAPRARLIAAP